VNVARPALGQGRAPDFLPGFPFALRLCFLPRHVRSRPEGWDEAMEIASSLTVRNVAENLLIAFLLLSPWALSRVKALREVIGTRAGEHDPKPGPPPQPKIRAGTLPHPAGRYGAQAAATPAGYAPPRPSAAAGPGGPRRSTTTSLGAPPCCTFNSRGGFSWA